jgi:hypothetical protein
MQRLSRCACVAVAAHFAADRALLYSANMLPTMALHHDKFSAGSERRCVSPQAASIAIVQAATRTGGANALRTAPTFHAVIHNFLP